MFGKITNAKSLGGWDLKLESAEKLPQDLATAFYKLYGDKFGGAYKPIFYVGSQLVNGVNYKIAVERTKLISGGKSEKDFAIVTINVPAGDIKAEKATIVSEEDANDFVLRDEIETGVKKALAEHTGLGIKPILELGTQIVKGMNYHFLCECQISHKDTEPYLARVVINCFQDIWTVVEIKKL